MKLLKQLLIISSMLMTTQLMQAASKLEIGLSSTNIYAGEEFQLRIKVSDSNNATLENLLDLQKNFTVRIIGGSPQRTSRTTIINGKRSSIINRSYTLSIGLTSNKTGTVIIPPIKIESDGKILTHPGGQISIKKLESNPNLFLETKFVRNEVYVGEPVELNVCVYTKINFSQSGFILPFMNEKDFMIFDKKPNSNTNPGRLSNQYLHYQQKRIITKVTQTKYHGEKFNLIKFSKIIVPKNAAEYTFPAATLSFTEGRRDPFASSFFNNRKDVKRRFLAKAKTLKLKVKPLPKEGQPAEFAGHIGQYEIKTTLDQKEMNIGEPITLSVLIKGSDFPERIFAPAIHKQENLNTSFQIPSEPDSEKVAGDWKIFTYKIRAKSAKTSYIPAITLPYFDTKSGIYKTTKSQKIPIMVKANKVITVADAEGNNQIIDAGKKVAGWKRGIAFNYTGQELLNDQQCGVRTWKNNNLTITFLAGCPTIYIILLIIITIQRKHDPEIAKRKRAFSTLKNEMKSSIKDANWHENILIILQQYFTQKLSITSASLTFSDIAPLLKKYNIDSQTQQKLQYIFTTCEAGRYAASDLNKEEFAKLCQTITTTIETIENGVK